jgi:GDPmannose 4,6-dehydratase
MGIQIVELDLLDRQATTAAMGDLQPTEVYNLAGHSFVPASWDDPAAAIRITSWPAIHLLEGIRASCPKAKFYQSSSSELFGSSPTSPQDEYTPVAPANPYAAAKVFAHQIVGLYRQHHGLFAVSGILYNHESPRRPPVFVTRKVVQAAVQIKAGKQKELVLGDLDVTRDWGFAGDFVDAMWRMLQIDQPSDFVIGTGIPHTVRDLCRLAFEGVGLDYRDYVRVDAAFQRSDQPTRLLANPVRAHKMLDWRATKTFEELIQLMVEAEASPHS